MCKKIITAGMATIAFLLSGAPLAVETASDFAATPPNITQSLDPFVMISLSVELTQQAEAYTDGEQDYTGGTYCPGRLNGVGICYSGKEVYLGYFDPKKCYVYDTRGRNTDTDRVQKATGPQNNASPHHFRPVGYANASHECDGQFSGNFMNWATMTALDEFRYAMTGGARLVDTAGRNAKTLLTRTHRYGDWDFVTKKISYWGGEKLEVDGERFVNDVTKLTPFTNIFWSDRTITIDNGNDVEYGNKVNFWGKHGKHLGEYNVIVEVCNPEVGLEPNCVEYTDGTHTWYKPEGAMQKHALEMRFALTSYSGQDGNERNGGVLRANAKYIGYRRPAAKGGLEVNSNAEIDAQGRYVFNPDQVKLENGVKNSGILNYINSFGLGNNRYKSNDPVAELYYEGLRYIKNLGPTPEYYGASGKLKALSGAELDNFPIVTNWDDPVVDSCQANYMIAIGDQFSWGDNSLPGSTILGSGIPSAPSNPDTDINVSELTNKVGLLEEFHKGSLGRQTRGRDNNGWYLAGLAYYANTEDLRGDFSGKQTVKTFVVDTQEYKSNPPMKQENPLWLAAKYGGFNDDNDDKDPNNGTPRASTAEWDADGDGEPDTYTLASQPANLIKGLNAAFNEILEGVISGTSAAVVTNTAIGGGAVYQGLYRSSTSEGNDKVEWVGIVHGLFFDEYGNFREDNGDGKLTNADPIVRFVYSAKEQKTLVERWETADGGESVTSDKPVQTGIEIEDLDTIWNARDELAKLDDVTSQRSYGTSAGSGRHIFTAIDSDADGIAVHADVLDFTRENFPAADAAGAGQETLNNFRYLGLTSETGDQAPNIVDFIRGQEGIAGYRSRTLDYEDNDENERNVWRLGDVIHSSPLAVAAPRDRYDRFYGDHTYEAYRQQYLDRRHVVYAGANDGMLHAFNAGFYVSFDPDTNAVTREFRTAPASGRSVTRHPLGSELWAYVPYNVLPHLRWLTEPEYPHVYYVDGIPQVFDVNIFDGDNCTGGNSPNGGTTDNTPCTHPYGWGTILVVGLRFGGGEITFDPDSDADGDVEDDVTTRSSYIILDITDPEQAPKLIAEVSHPQMGYTTGRPTLIKKRLRNTDSGTYESPAANEWYLVLGSGPAGSDATARRLALTDGVSDQNARLFVFDLKEKEFVTFGQNEYLDVTGASNGFVGDLTAVDWDGDFVDDVVYFGTVQGSVAEPAGELMRFTPGAGLELASATTSKLLDKTGGLKQPFNGRPHVRTDITGRDHWIHVGSGRFYVPDDNLSASQQSYYGVKEPVDKNGAFTFSTVDVTRDLIDTKSIEVYSDESLRKNGSDTVTLSNGAKVKTFTELRQAIGKAGGWFFNFDDIRARQVGRSDRLEESILFTEYVPSGKFCDPLGETYLNAVHFETGTAAPFAALNDEDDDDNDGDNNSPVISERSVYHGPGLIRDVHVSGGPDGKNRVVGQDGTGGLTSEDVRGRIIKAEGRMSWRELEYDW